MFFVLAPLDVLVSFRGSFSDFFEGANLRLFPFPGKLPGGLFSPRYLVVPLVRLSPACFPFGCGPAPLTATEQVRSRISKGIARSPFTFSLHPLPPSPYGFRNKAFCRGFLQPKLCPPMGGFLFPPTLIFFPSFLDG